MTSLKNFEGWYCRSTFENLDSSDSFIKWSLQVIIVNIQQNTMNWVTIIHGWLL